MRKVVEISQLYARRLLFDFGGFWGIAMKTLEEFEDQASDFGYVLSHACCVPAYLIRGDLARGEETTRTAMTKYGTAIEFYRIFGTGLQSIWDSHRIK